MASKLLQTLAFNLAFDLQVFEIDDKKVPLALMANLFFHDFYCVLCTSSLMEKVDFKNKFVTFEGNQV